MKDYAIIVRSYGDEDVYLCRQCRDEAEAKTRVKEHYAKMHIKLKEKVNYGVYISDIKELKDEPLVTVASFSPPDPGYEL